MRFKVTGDHRKVLEKQKFIEFEDVFSLDDIETASQHVDRVLGKRAKQLIDTQSCVQLYHEVQNILTEDAPHWWLWDRYYPIAFSAALTGLPQDPTAYGAFDQVGWTK